MNMDLRFMYMYKVPSTPKQYTQVPSYHLTI